MLLRENVPLAPMTTLGVGGPARYFHEALAENEVAEAVNFTRSRHLPLFVMGGGSNVVFRDAGFHGLVLKIGTPGIAEVENAPGCFRVGAGVDWDEFVSYAVQRNYAGIECLSGIPGTVGGTPVQNVGAYGQDVSQRIFSVEAYDRFRGENVTLNNDECGFGYRSSIFNTDERGRYIIVAVSFSLSKDGLLTLTYPDLQRHFAQQSHKPTVAEVREAVLAIRRQKGMVLDSSDPDTRSAGSFFKNPVLSIGEFERLSSRLAPRGLRPPTYAIHPRRYKIPAAWLVEQAGFVKGYRKGNAGISSKHTLAIVNRGGATAGDILTLKDEIQAKVREHFGIDLEPEPVVVAF